MCCNTCWNGIHADHNKKFHCRKCGQERLAQPRCSLAIELSNGATTLPATIFGENVEKVFNITAAELMELTEKPHKLQDHDEPLETTIQHKVDTSKEYYFLLKQSKKYANHFIVAKAAETPPLQDTTKVTEDFQNQKDQKTQ